MFCSVVPPTTTISEDEAKTVILEKENELKEKVGSEGLNTRVFKRYAFASNSPTLSSASRQSER